MAASVALAHDYLNQRGGAERVVLELARAYPGAPIHTALYRPESTFEAFRDLDVRASPLLDHLPVDRSFRALLPAYPAAIGALGTIEADVVISSSSAWAHGVRTRPGAAHVCYCHTPARWLWDGGAYGSAAGRTALRPVFDALRRWDRAAAARPTRYVANSERTAKLIRQVYDRPATVVHPPIDVARFTPRPRGTRLLVIARLMDYKRVDLAVDAATRAGIGLDVVGDGPELASLRARAGRHVTFHGRAEDAVVTELLGSCRALVVCAKEDFGMAPLEANAAGKPVVALRAGGVLESQVEGVTAELFDHADPMELLEAVARADALTTSPASLRAHADGFAPAAFRAAMAREVELARAEVQGARHLRAVPDATEGYAAAPAYAARMRSA